MCWCPECGDDLDCPCDREVLCDGCRVETYDADELGLDPEEPYDYA